MQQWEKNSKDNDDVPDNVEMVKIDVSDYRICNKTYNHHPLGMRSAICSTGHIPCSLITYDSNK